MPPELRAPCRLLLLGSALLLAGLVVAGVPTDAEAHGGRYIPPPPPIGPPPAPRGPRIPTPGTPRGPQNPLSPTTPGSLPPSQGTPGQAPPPSAPTALTPRSRGRQVVNPNHTWETWWSLNRLGYLPDRREAFERHVLTPRDEDDPRYWTRRRVEVSEKRIVPFLKSLLDPKRQTRDDVKASALIALAKVTGDPRTPDLLLEHLRDPRAANIVRESAALALGLLRRTDPELQLDPARLDRLREELIAAADDTKLPMRARAFCVLATGLLADQPYAGPYAKDGRLVTRALWLRLDAPFTHRDLPIALLTAIGMQPPAGVPSGVRDGLRLMVIGKRVHGRRWDSVERGHALTALLRLGGPGTDALLQRVLERKREHTDVKRAAYLALGLAAPRLDPEERADAARALHLSFKGARDPMTRGLAHLAAGHLLAADLQDGRTTLLLDGKLSRELLSETRGGAQPSRGFSVLALALAIRDAPQGERCVEVFRNEAQKLLLDDLARRRGDPSVLGARVVAVGLAGVTEGRPALLTILADRGAPPVLRGHAAVALGQLGRATPDVLRTLHLALAERRDLELRRQAALGLALLGGQTAVTQLLRQLEQGDTERLLAQVVIALGRLGDLAAVGPITAYARDEERSELTQALAVVALGLLGDPEPRPSLLRLTWSGFYPARTEALDEAYTIL